MKTRHLFLIVVLILCASVGTYAQEGLNKSPSAATTTVTITAASTPLELARAAFLAQGGEKFKNLENMVLMGSVNIYPPNSVRSIPGNFVIATDGVRKRWTASWYPTVLLRDLRSGRTLCLPNTTSRT
jgi:hypothetical protein